MVCQKCGEKNQDDAKFCLKCGNSLSLNTNQTIDNTQNNINNSKIQNQKNKLKIIIIILVVILLLGIGLVFNKIKNKDKDVKIAFDTNALIKVKKDSKYGYINTDGKLVIDYVFESADDYIGNYAYVKKYKEIEGEKELYNIIIDKKGNEILSCDYYDCDIDYIDEYNIWIIDGKIFDNEMKQKTPNDLNVEYEEDGYLTWEDKNEKTVGIMDYTGKIIFKYMLEFGESYISLDVSYNASEFKDKYCKISISSDKYAIINCDTGKVVYDFTKNYISSHSDNRFSIKDDTGKYKYYYIQNDKMAYTSDEQFYVYFYKNDSFVSITDYSKDYDNRYTYIDLKTGNILSSKPESSNESPKKSNEWEEYTGIEKILCNKGYGLNNGSEIIVPCEWKSIEYFDLLLYKYLSSNGKQYVILHDNNKVSLFNLKTNKVEKELNTNKITIESSSPLITYKDNDTSEKYIYNLLNSKSLKVEDGYQTNLYSNYFTTTNNENRYYYNLDMKLIYTEKK